MFSHKSIARGYRRYFIEERKLEWDTRVRDVLPGWSLSDETIRENVTVADIFPNRAGFSVGDYYLGAEK
jgi:hypothetical protein